MFSYDARFYYFHQIRHVLMNKIFISSNTYNIPSIVKLRYFFLLSRIEDIHDVQLYNYLYLFKYFFGKYAYLTRIRSFFNVGKWSYSLQVNLYLTNNFYKHLFFFVNDIFLMSESVYRKFGVYSYVPSIYYVTIMDLAIFSEKKTNLGLFFLSRPMTLHIFFKGGDVTNLSNVLNNFKMRLI